MRYNINTFLLYVTTTTRMFFIKEKVILRKMMEPVFQNGHKNHIYWDFELIIFPCTSYSALVNVFQPLNLLKKDF